MEKLMNFILKMLNNNDEMVKKKMEIMALENKDLK